MEPVCSRTPRNRYIIRLAMLCLVSALFAFSRASAQKVTQKVLYPTPHWARSTAINTQINQNALGEIDSIMRAAHANGILIRDGYVVAEWNYDKPIDTKIEVQSITKSMISLLLGIALDDGKIKNIGDKVFTYFPAFDVGPYTKEITFRHLVTVSSGIEAKKHGKNYGNPNNMQPGVDARYHNDHFDQLAKALTYIFGEPLLDVLNKRVLSVIGAEVEWRTDGEVISRTGERIPVNAGYAFIKWSATDLAKIGYLYLNQGNWNGKQLISSQYVKNTMTPIQIPLMVSRPNRTVREDLNNTYGYGWRGIKMRDKVLWYASGNGGQFCAVVPERGLVFVKINGYSDSYRPYRGLSAFKEALSRL